MEKVKKLGKIAYYVFLGALGVTALLVIFSAFPIAGNYKLMVVRSGSMEPSIKMGSIVLVKPSDYYAIGDIVSFNAGFRGPDGKNVPVTHRIYEMRVDQGNPVYFTKGDANEDVDARELRNGNVIGRALFSVPYVGYAVETARQPYGFLALIIIPALMIVYDQARKIFGEVKRMKMENKKT